MNSGAKKCVRYWIQSNPKQFLWILLAIAFSLIKGFLITDLLAMIIITGRTIEVFNSMTYSLPFSRKEIWNLHVVVEMCLLILYMIIKIFQNINNVWMIILQIFFVLFAFWNLMILPRKREFWWIGVVPIFVVTNLYENPQVKILKEKLMTMMACNEAFICAIVLEIVFVLIIAHRYIVESRRFING